MKLNTPPSQTGALDSKADVEVEEDKLVEDALQMYRSSLDEILELPVEQGTNYYLRKNLVSLSPEQVDMLLQRLIREDANVRQDLGMSVISSYVSALIQKSYEAGHNGFTLHTHNVPLDYLCAHLEGASDNPLQVAIKGDVGNVIGSYNLWCTIDHDGSGGNYYLYSSKFCEAFVAGTVGKSPLDCALHSVIRTTNEKTFREVKDHLKGLHYYREREILLVDSEGTVLKSYSNTDKGKGP